MVDFYCAGLNRGSSVLSHCKRQRSTLLTNRRLTETRRAQVVPAPRAEGVSRPVIEGDPDFEDAPPEALLPRPRHWRSRRVAG
jgi:hypothetical protein